MSDRLDGARLLITGSTGFVGTFLGRAALLAGAAVFGIDKVSSCQSEGISTFAADLADVESTREILRQAAPTHIAHLAGGLPGASPGFAAQYEMNTLATASLYEAIAGASVLPLVLVGSSSAVYGAGRPGSRLSEDDELKPVSHYGVSKLGQEMVARMYQRTRDVPTIVARTFNLVGPRQSPTLVASDVARQIVQAERQSGPPVVRVGDLTPVRDFVDVRDASRAYLGLLRCGVPGATYNVCRGTGHTVGECVQTLVSMSRVPIDVQQDPSRMRPTSEIPVQVGDPTRLHALNGWRAEIPLSESLRDVLDHWRAQS